ncbi:unnamed protein product [Amoebophrya sp. A25]|nr:unnamed protein product [Amoebophrya sp. A25]|eukprot:GSA25T00017365001.1
MVVASAYLEVLLDNAVSQLPTGKLSGPRCRGPGGHHHFTTFANDDSEEQSGEQGTDERDAGGADAGAPAKSSWTDIQKRWEDYFKKHEEGDGEGESGGAGRAGEANDDGEAADDGEESAEQGDSTSSFSAVRAEIARLGAPGEPGECRSATIPNDYIKTLKPGEDFVIFRIPTGINNEREFAENSKLMLLELQRRNKTVPKVPPSKVIFKLMRSGMSPGPTEDGTANSTGDGDKSSSSGTGADEVKHHGSVAADLMNQKKCSKFEDETKCEEGNPARGYHKTKKQGEDTSDDGTTRNEEESGTSAFVEKEPEETDGSGKKPDPDENIMEAGGQANEDAQPRPSEDEIEKDEDQANEDAQPSSEAGDQPPSPSPTGDPQAQAEGGIEGGEDTTAPPENESAANKEAGGQPTAREEAPSQAEKEGAAAAGKEGETATTRPEKQEDDTSKPQGHAAKKVEQPSSSSSSCEYHDSAEQKCLPAIPTFKQVLQNKFHVKVVSSNGRTAADAAGGAEESKGEDAPDASEQSSADSTEPLDFAALAKKAGVDASLSVEPPSNANDPRFVEYEDNPIRMVKVYTSRPSQLPEVPLYYEDEGGEAGAGAEESRGEEEASSSGTDTTVLGGKGSSSSESNASSAASKRVKTLYDYMKQAAPEGDEGDVWWQNNSLVIAFRRSALETQLEIPKDIKEKLSKYLPSTTASPHLWTGRAKPIVLGLSEKAYDNFKLGAGQNSDDRIGEGPGNAVRTWWSGDTEHVGFVEPEQLVAPVKAKGGKEAFSGIIHPLDDPVRGVKYTRITINGEGDAKDSLDVVAGEEARPRADGGEGDDGDIKGSEEGGGEGDDGDIKGSEEGDDGDIKGSEEGEGRQGKAPPINFSVDSVKDALRNLFSRVLKASTRAAAGEGELTTEGGGDEEEPSGEQTGDSTAAERTHEQSSTGSNALLHLDSLKPHQLVHLYNGLPPKVRYNCRCNPMEPWSCSRVLRDFLWFPQVQRQRAHPKEVIALKPADQIEREAKIVMKKEDRIACGLDVAPGGKVEFDAEKCKSFNHMTCADATHKDHCIEPWCKWDNDACTDGYSHGEAAGQYAETEGGGGDEDGGGGEKEAKGGEGETEERAGEPAAEEDNAGGGEAEPSAGAAQEGGGEQDESSAGPAGKEASSAEDKATPEKEGDSASAPGAADETPASPNAGGEATADESKGQDGESAPAAPAAAGEPPFEEPKATDPADVAGTTAAETSTPAPTSPPPAHEETRAADQTPAAGETHSAADETPQESTAVTPGAGKTPAAEGNPAAAEAPTESPAPAAAPEAEAEPAAPTPSPAENQASDAAAPPPPSADK